MTILQVCPDISHLFVAVSERFVAGAALDFIFHVAGPGPLPTPRPPLTPRAGSAENTTGQFLMFAKCMV